MMLLPNQLLSVAYRIASQGRDTAFHMMLKKLYLNAEIWPHSYSSGVPLEFCSF